MCCVVTEYRVSVILGTAVSRPDLILITNSGGSEQIVAVLVKLVSYQVLSLTQCHCHNKTICSTTTVLFVTSTACDLCKAVVTG